MIALRAMLAAALLPALAGCSTSAYYWQLMRGQVQLLSAREPIDAVLRDPAADAQLRTRLALVQDARRYAASTLHLPDNRSYTLYADVHRDYVVWNVFATPEFSLDAVESCFPIAGCLAYRGFYDEAAARAHAEKLRAQGYDTHVGGVAAYSTLGWFDDPVINTMMRWSDDELVGTVFHELAHQTVYVKNDTAFNESFASFVESQGLADYDRARGRDAEADGVRGQRERQFTALVLDARDRLRQAYAAAPDDGARRQAKQAAFDDLKTRYRQLRDRDWNGYAGYDGFFARPLNNARLLPFGLYDQWVPAFATLWREQNRDWPAFYEAAAKLGKLAPAPRLDRLRTLAAR